MSLDLDPRQTEPDGVPASPDGSDEGRALPIGPIVGVVIAVVIGVAQPAIVQGTLGSPRALAILAGIIAATIGWSALLRRWEVPAWGRALAVGIPLAIVGWFAVAPYFMGDEVVDEALPPVAAAPDEPADAAAPAPADPAEEAEAAEAEQPAVPDDAPAPADEAPEAAPPAPAAEEDDAPAAEAAPAPAEQEAAAPAEEPPAEEVPAGPVELSRGTFVGLDGHFAEGQAALYDLGADQRIVRLEDVNLQRVPNAFVYLVPGLDQTTPIDGSLNLGALTGNVGSSNYEVPADADLSGDWTVLVWCEPFSSPVGAASQSATPSGSEPS